MHELVSDLVKKAKEIDSLIEVLPGIQQTEEEQIAILKALEEENKLANQEYEEAVKEMGNKIDAIHIYMHIWSLFRECQSTDQWHFKENSRRTELTATIIPPYFYSHIYKKKERETQQISIKHMFQL